MKFSIIDGFMGYLKSARGRSDLTVKEYAYDLQNFFLFLLNIEEGEDEAIFEKVTPKVLQGITRKDIYDYLTYLEFYRKNSNRTKSRKLSTLKTFFAYLYEVEGLIRMNPTEGVHTPKISKTLPVYMNFEEATRLLEAAEEETDSLQGLRDYTILTLFLNCGMRLSELAKINVEDISSNETIRVHGKGDKERTVYLNTACMAALEDYLPLRRSVETEDRALFLSNRKTRMSVRSIQYMVEKYVRKAGLDPKITVHKLRHTAATLMYQYGSRDLRALQEILGHESIHTTEIYTHVENEHLRQTTMDNPLARRNERPKD